MFDFKSELENATNELESADIRVKDAIDKIEKVKDRIDELENLEDEDIIKQTLDSMGTDKVAEIFYHIKNSHHGSHIDNFSYLDRG